jgi:hypothetical protein
MGRDVTLTIKVKDGEVVKAEQSLNRLNKAADNVGNSGLKNRSREVLLADSERRAIEAAAKRIGISYEEMAAKIKGATGATKEATTAIAEVTEVSAGASRGLAGVGGAAGIAGLAIAGIVIVIVAAVAAAAVLAKQVFDLAKGFADYATEIGKAAEETGLTTETVSALKHEAEATGREFGTISGAVNNFRKLIGQAAAGSEDARKSLALLGLDGKKAITDIDGAFKQAVAVIAGAKTPFDQVRLAVAAFGNDGVKLLPFIREFGGDIDALKKKAEELGIQISGKNVQQAQEFNRAYADLQKVIKGLTDLFGREFLPIVTQALQDVTNWLRTNKDEIKSWATWSAESIKSIVEWWGSAWTAAKAYFDGIAQQDKVMRNNVFPTDASVPNQPKRTTLPLGGLPIDANKTYGTMTMVPGADQIVDTAAAAAAFEEAEKRRKKAFDEAQKRAKAIAELISDLTNKNKYFGDSSEVTATKLRLEAIGIKGLADSTSQYALQLAAGIDQKKKDADAEKERKKAREDYEKALARSQKDITSTEFVSRVDLGAELRELQQRIELGHDLNTVQLKEIANFAALQKADKEWQDAGLSKTDIADLTASLQYEQSVTLEIVKHVQALRDRVKEEEKLKKLHEEEKNYLLSLQDEFDAVNRNNRPLSRYEEVLRDITRNHKDFDEATKQSALQLAAQTDAVERLNRQHAELKEFFSENLRYVFEGDFKGLVENLRRSITEPFIDRISDFLATSILGFDPNATNNPVAKRIDTTNKLLASINARLGGSPVAGAGLGSVGSLFGLGGGGGGGIGPGGTPYFNPSSGGGGFGGLGGLRLPGDLTGTIGSNGAYNVDGRSLWQKLTGQGGLLGKGGIFGPKGFGNNVGTYGAIGSVGGLLGGLIGGRVGGVISGAGSGLAIGAQLGSIIPGVGTAIGAAVGAIAGGLLGLFGGDPKRKQDKKENIPALNKGFVDAFKELNDILAGIRTLSIDPDEAISRANEVRGQIAGGFGIQFLSKKYRKQSQQMIAAKLTEADVIIGQIKSAAEIARGAADRSKRILPEFAGGHYFADYFRPNGLLPGMFDGRDNILAMISRGEMVLNPSQQARVRALAGGDVFAGAGIPNYPKASASPQLAIGGIAGAGLALSTQTPVIQPNFTLFLQGIVSLDSEVKAVMQSDDGRRHMVKIIKEEKKADRGL